MGRKNIKTQYDFAQKKSKLPRHLRRKDVKPKSGSIIAPKPGASGNITDKDMIGPNLIEAKYAALSEHSKTIYLIDRVKELFKIQISKGRVEIQRQPTADTVSHLAYDLLHLWPKDWRMPEAENTEDFSLLFVGHPTPSSVANAITRATLYADRIYVVNPFCNLFLHHPQQSPVLRPDVWTQFYAANSIYVAVLEPWIRAGLVEMVPNPYQFSVDTCFLNSEKVAEHTDLMLKQLGMPWAYQSFVESQAQMCLQLHPENRTAFLEVALQSVPNSRKAAFQRAVEHEMQRIVRTDPWQTVLPKARAGPQMAVNGTGLGYEHARFMAAALGATVFSDLVSYRKQLEMEPTELNAPFQQAAHAFGSARYNFLNNVHPQFALELRGEKRLASFRHYLGSLAKNTSFKDKDAAIIPTAVQEFNVRFEDEYERYKQEWADIQKKLATQTALAIGSIGLSAVVATGGLRLGLLAAPAVINVASNLVTAAFDRKKLQRQPLSIIQQLDRATS